jgi:hypothetical protein
VYNHDSRILASNALYLHLKILICDDLWRFQALAVFLITVHAYADEKSDMEELSMVALSGCIWLQAFVVTLDTK